LSLFLACASQTSVLPRLFGLRTIATKNAASTTKSSRLRTRFDAFVCCGISCMTALTKNMREAQQVSQYNHLPVVGYVLLMREAVLGTATQTQVLLSVGVNVVVFAVRLLNSESVILGAA